MLRTTCKENLTCKSCFSAAEWNEDCVPVLAYTEFTASYKMRDSHGTTVSAFSRTGGQMLVQPSEGRSWSSAVKKINLIFLPRPVACSLPIKPSSPTSTSSY
eukprot:3147719-Amphidinium_carterae.1